MTELYRKILDASIELVAEQGVRAVSFREVARRAGVSHQAPYHHFGNYQGILRAIAEEGFETLADAMQAAGAAADDPLQGLVDAGLAYIDFAREHVGHFNVMFQRKLVDIHDEEAPIPAAERTYETLLSLAKDAVDAGYGKGLPTDAVAHMCWSMVHGFANLLLEEHFKKKGIVEPEEEAAMAQQMVRAMQHLLDSKG